MSKQVKPTYAKMKSKKRKGFVRTSKLVICGDVVYLSRESIDIMGDIDNMLK